jgi:hypothetical protein
LSELRESSSNSKQIGLCNMMKALTPLMPESIRNLHDSENIILCERKHRDLLYGPQAKFKYQQESN